MRCQHTAQCYCSQLQESTSRRRLHRPISSSSQHGAARGNRKVGLPYGLRKRRSKRELVRSRIYIDHASVRLTQQCTPPAKRRCWQLLSAGPAKETEEKHALSSQPLLSGGFGFARKTGLQRCSAGARGDVIFSGRGADSKKTTRKMQIASTHQCRGRSADGHGQQRQRSERCRCGRSRSSELGCQRRRRAR